MRDPTATGIMDRTSEGPYNVRLFRSATLPALSELSSDGSGETDFDEILSKDDVGSIPSRGSTGAGDVDLVFDNAWSLAAGPGRIGPAAEIESFNTGRLK